MVNLDELKVTYREFVDELIQSGVDYAKTHFGHISGNCMTLINLLENADNLDEGERFMIFSTGLYFDLLDKYPSFKKAEFSQNGQPCFSDIPHSGDGGANTYINESRRRLEDLAENLGRIFPGNK